MSYTQFYNDFTPSYSKDCMIEEGLINSYHDSISIHDDWEEGILLTFT